MTTTNRFAGLLLLLGLLGAARVAADVWIDEGFPGCAEHPGWHTDWIVGVGQVTFDPNAPGVARYRLTGPGAAGVYHNAELYDPGQPPYCDFEVRLRNRDNCGFDAPSWPPAADPNYGFGTRGWGLWNRVTSPDQGPMNQIWFACASPESDAPFRGRRVWVLKDSVPVVVQELDIDLTQWHTYRIKWRPDYIGVFVDDMQAPVVEVTDPALIPDVSMTYTTWIDNNAFLGTSFEDMEQVRLAVPDFDEYLVVDYIRVYTVTSPADVNEDGEVDGDDLALLAGCLAGPDVSPAAGCATSDLDDDGDVDSADYAAFQQALGQGP